VEISGARRTLRYFCRFDLRGDAGAMHRVMWHSVVIAEPQSL
jgi:hypothetical protein